MPRIELSAVLSRAASKFLQSRSYTTDYARARFIGMEDDTILSDAKKRFIMGLHFFLLRLIQEKELEQTLVRYALKGQGRIWLSGSGSVGSS